jgi:CTP synthase (UTP-ammonia lyase)
MLFSSRQIKMSKQIEKSSAREVFLRKRKGINHRHRYEVSPEVIQQDISTSASYDNAA